MCSSFHVLHDGLNSNKIHFVKSSNCLIPCLAVAVTSLNQQELYTWMGEPWYWNWGLDGQPEIDTFGGRVRAFEEAEAEVFGLTAVFINSWLVLCSAVCLRIPGPAGFACMPFPAVGVAAAGHCL